MKQFRNWTAAIAVLVSSLIIGCNDQGIDNSKVAFKMASVTDKGENAAEAAGQFNEAFLGVSELEFVVTGEATGKTAGGGEGKDNDKDRDKNNGGGGHHDDDDEEEDDDDDEENDGDDDDGEDDDDEENDEDEDEEDDGDDEDDEEDGDSNSGENGGDDDQEEDSGSGDTSGDDQDTDVENDNDPGNGESPAPAIPTNRNIVLKGGFIVDLLRGTSTPDFGVADVFPGTYKSIRLKLAPILPGGKSILISKTLMSEALGEEKVVEFSLEGELQIMIESTNGFTLEGGDFKQFLVLLDLNALFQWVDLVQAVPNEHGIIAINEKSNAAMAAQIKTKLSQVVRVVEGAN
jgi:hypothetical protein